MYAAYEAILHRAIIAPVVVLGGLLDAVCRTWDIVCHVADFLSGNPPRRPGSGMNELRVA